MGLFNLFGSKPKEEIVPQFAETPMELPEGNKEQDDSTKVEPSENKQKIITINTKMHLSIQTCSTVRQERVSSVTT